MDSDNVGQGTGVIRNVHLATDALNYVHDADKRWFVVRSSFNRGEKAYDFLLRGDFHAYLPVRLTEKVKGRHLIRAYEPLIPNILFVYAEESALRDFMRENKDVDFLSLYYNHFEQDNFGKDKLMEVRTGEMDNFIRATMVESPHTMVVDPTKVRYKTGDTVRVVEGDFVGVVGKVARIGGQSRVVVTLDGVCSIATAYIPSAFLEPYKGS